MKVPASAATPGRSVTFASETTLHFNGDEIRSCRCRRRTTDGDIFVHFEKADDNPRRDLFFNGRYPFHRLFDRRLARRNDRRDENAVRMTTRRPAIIPGHGPLADAGRSARYLAFLETCSSASRKLKNEGKTVDEVVAAAPAKEFDEKLGKGFISRSNSSAIAYTGLLKHG